MISKKASVVALVGLVFVVGGTASVLESFGVVSGTADVESPTFYAGSDNSLYLDGDDAGHYATDLTADENESYSYSFGNSVDWYSSNFDINARIEDNSGTFNLTMYLSYDDSQGDEVFICNQTKTVEKESGQVDFDKCSMGSKSIQSFTLKLNSNVSEGEVHLEQSEKTFVEVKSK